MNDSHNSPPPPPSDDSDDERADAMLIHAARDYNLPGAVPREEMWAKISDARRITARNASPARSIEPAQKRNVWLFPGIGVAAALLISTGIVIGRQMSARKDNTTVASTPVAQPTVVASKPASPTPATDTLRDQLRQETQRTSRAAQALAANSSSAPMSRDEATADVQQSRTLAYQLVVMRHLAGTEAMITSFESSARRGLRDSTMAQWSRELLSTTRTLEAARATNDPVMRRLLDDLDLVLTQIVQYTTKGTYDPDELNLIDQSIKRRSVMSNLRSNLAARQMPVGL